MLPHIVIATYCTKITNTARFKPLKNLRLVIFKLEFLEDLGRERFQSGLESTQEGCFLLFRQFVIQFDVDEVQKNIPYLQARVKPCGDRLSSKR